MGQKVALHANAPSLCTIRAPLAPGRLQRPSAPWAGTFDNYPEPFVVLLDVAKAFPCTIHDVIFSILTHAGFPPNYVATLRTVYTHADTYTDIQGERIYFKPTCGVKEGYRCSPPLFSIVYELLIKRLVSNKYPDTFVYVDDIAIIAKDYSEL